MAIELTERILQYVEKHGNANSLDLVKIFDEDHQKIIGAIKSLQTLDNVIDVEQVCHRKWEPTAEGQHVIDQGSHEAAVYKAIPNEGILQSEVMASVPYAKVGFAKALVAGWIKLDKSTGKSIVTRNVDAIADITQINLKNINGLADSVKSEYKKRKLIQENIIKSVIVKKGNNFTIKIAKQEADLTSDLLVNDVWKIKKFKPYNFNALGAALDVGHLHPLLKVRSEFRKIFLEMGFTEMPTNNFVESSFWNFDALFQPQQHPARDAHDTFFISDPKFTTNFPQEYLEKVQQIHSKGGYGSEGYRYDWKIEEAQKNLMRTHTTAISARMLYNLMEKGEFKPVRYFSIDRVFRNETLDATHLAEFHQVEGVVADYNLTLGDLIGTLYAFFKKLGIDKLKFKPAYNPYTEPSMEIFCFHEGLGKWIEIGNSGIFRPEMLLPMGLPDNVNVIAWGLSLERPTMIKYKLNNIRDLVGPKVDLQMVYNNPICRLEKVAGYSQPSEIIQQSEASNVSWKTCDVIEKQNLVIFCDPKFPLFWLENLIKLIKDHIKITLTIHQHSSIKGRLPQYENFCSDLKNNAICGDISIVFIWKTVGIDPVLKFDHAQGIFGQVNIARYFNRLIEQVNPTLLRYESNGPLYANKIDSVLDKIHFALHTSNERKLLNSFKQQSKPYMFEELSIVDLIIAAQ